MDGDMAGGDDALPADGYAEIDQNFATNVRERREEAQLSQDALAQRMIDRGFGFSQATIWKIEQGKRPVKISEAAALADALGLFGMSSLAVTPSTARLEARLTRSNRHAFTAYERLKDAAADYIQAQVALAYDAFTAREAGLRVNELSTSWLTIPAVQAAIEAQVAYEQEDTVREGAADTTATITATTTASMRDNGVDPVIDLDAITRTGPDLADPPAPSTHTSTNGAAAASAAGEQRG